MSTGWSSTKPIYLNPMSFSRNLDTHVDPDSVLIVDWNKFEVEIPLWLDYHKKLKRKKLSLRGLKPVTLCTPIVVKSLSIPWKLGTKWLVLFFPADFLDTLKLSREQHEMGDSDGVGFFQEKSAGKKLIRLFVPNFLGLYNKLLPETWFWAVTKDV